MIPVEAGLYNGHDISVRPYRVQQPCSIQLCFQDAREERTKFNVD